MNDPSVMDDEDISGSVAGDSSVQRDDDVQVDPSQASEDGLIAELLEMTQDSPREPDSDAEEEPMEFHISQLLEMAPQPAQEEKKSVARPRRVLAPVVEQSIERRTQRWGAKGCVFSSGLVMVGDAQRSVEVLRYGQLQQLDDFGDVMSGTCHLLDEKGDPQSFTHASLTSQLSRAHRLFHCVQVTFGLGQSHSPALMGRIRAIDTPFERASESSGHSQTRISVLAVAHQLAVLRLFARVCISNPNVTIEMLPRDRLSRVIRIAAARVIVHGYSAPLETCTFVSDLRRYLPLLSGVWDMEEYIRQRAPHLAADREAMSGEESVRAGRTRLLRLQRRGVAGLVPGGRDHRVMANALWSWIRHRVRCIEDVVQLYLWVSEEIQEIDQGRVSVTGQVFRDFLVMTVMDAPSPTQMKRMSDCLLGIADGQALRFLLQNIFDICHFSETLARQVSSSDWEKMRPFVPDGRGTPRLKTNVGRLRMPLNENGTQTWSGLADRNQLGCCIGLWLVGAGVLKERETRNVGDRVVEQWRTWLTSPRVSGAASQSLLAQSFSLTRQLFTAPGETDFLFGADGAFVRPEFLFPGQQPTSPLRSPRWFQREDWLSDDRMIGPFRSLVRAGMATDQDRVSRSGCVCVTAYGLQVGQLCPLSLLAEPSPFLAFTASLFWELYLMKCVAGTQVQPEDLAVEHWMQIEARVQLDSGGRGNMSNMPLKEFMERAHRANVELLTTMAARTKFEKSVEQRCAWNEFQPCPSRMMLPSIRGLSLDRCHDVLHDIAEAVDGLRALADAMVPVLARTREDSKVMNGGHFLLSYRNMILEGGRLSSVLPDELCRPALPSLRSSGISLQQRHRPAVLPGPLCLDLSGLDQLCLLAHEELGQKANSLGVRGLTWLLALSGLSALQHACAVPSSGFFGGTSKGKSFVGQCVRYMLGNELVLTVDRSSALGLDTQDESLSYHLVRLEEVPADMVGCVSDRDSANTRSQTVLLKMLEDSAATSRVHNKDDTRGRETGYNCAVTMTGNEPIETLSGAVVARTFISDHETKDCILKGRASAMSAACSSSLLQQMIPRLFEYHRLMDTLVLPPVDLSLVSGEGCFLDRFMDRLYSKMKHVYVNFRKTVRSQLHASTAPRPPPGPGQKGRDETVPQETAPPPLRQMTCFDLLREGRGRRLNMIVSLVRSNVILDRFCSLEMVRPFLELAGPVPIERLHALVCYASIGQMADAVRGAAFHFLTDTLVEGMNSGMVDGLVCSMGRWAVLLVISAKLMCVHGTGVPGQAHAFQGTPQEWFRSVDQMGANRRAHSTVYSWMYLLLAVSNLPRPPVSDEPLVGPGFLLDYIFNVDNVAHGRVLDLLSLSASAWRGPRYRFLLNMGLDLYDELFHLWHPMFGFDGERGEEPFNGWYQKNGGVPEFRVPGEMRNGQRGARLVVMCDAVIQYLARDVNRVREMLEDESTPVGRKVQQWADRGDSSVSEVVARAMRRFDRSDSYHTGNSRSVTRLVGDAVQALGTGRGDSGRRLPLVVCQNDNSVEAEAVDDFSRDEVSQLYQAYRRHTERKCFMGPDEWLANELAPHTVRNLKARRALWGGDSGVSGRYHSRDATRHATLSELNQHIRRSAKRRHSRRSEFLHEDYLVSDALMEAWVIVGASWGEEASDMNLANWTEVWSHPGRKQWMDTYREGGELRQWINARMAVAVTAPSAADILIKSKAAARERKDMGVEMVGDNWGQEPVAYVAPGVRLEPQESKKHNHDLSSSSSSTGVRGVTMDDFLAGTNVRKESHQASFTEACNRYDHVKNMTVGLLGCSSSRAEKEISGAQLFVADAGASLRRLSKSTRAVLGISRSTLMNPSGGLVLAALRETIEEEATALNGAQSGQFTGRILFGISPDDDVLGFDCSELGSNDHPGQFRMNRHSWVGLTAEIFNNSTGHVITNQSPLRDAYAAFDALHPHLRTSNEEFVVQLCAKRHDVMSVHKGRGCDVSCLDDHCRMVGVFFDYLRFGSSVFELMDPLLQPGPSTELDAREVLRAGTRTTHSMDLTELADKQTGGGRMALIRAVLSRGVERGHHQVEVENKDETSLQLGIQHTERLLETASRCGPSDAFTVDEMSRARSSPLEVIEDLDALDAAVEAVLAERLAGPSESMESVPALFNGPIRMPPSPSPPLRSPRRQASLSTSPSVESRDQLDEKHVDEAPRERRKRRARVLSDSDSEIGEVVEPLVPEARQRRRLEAIPNVDESMASVTQFLIEQDMAQAPGVNSALSLSIPGTPPGKTPSQLLQRSGDLNPLSIPGTP